jgi:hypothetical protein
MPTWFIQQIQANSDTYTLVVKEALGLQDWGLHADLQRYHHTDSLIQSIEGQVHTLNTEQDALRTQLRCMRF